MVLEFILLSLDLLRKNKSNDKTTSLIRFLNDGTYSMEKKFNNDNGVDRRLLGPGIGM